MQKAMTIKGFLILLGLILAVFLCLHMILKGDLSRKAEEENALRIALTRLQEEEKDLKAELSIVGTEDYIVSSARENYSYVNKDDIRFVLFEECCEFCDRFTYTNPEALYTYTEEELRILVDEMAD